MDVLREATRRYGFPIAALTGTALSMAMTGHVTGLWNNLFHLPILAGLAGMPQFARDPFIQSLPHYASGFWLMLAGVAPGDKAWPLLLALAIASRLLTMAAFLACADMIGISDLKGRLLFVVLIAFSSLANGYSTAGAGGLFISYFTHSEVANATILLSVWCAARGRFTAAFALNGATAFLNAFMAAWAAAPLGFIAILLLARGEIDGRTLARRMAIGLVPFTMLAAPAIYSIVSNPEFGRPSDFDFIAFITEYFPDHFLVAELSPKTLLAFIVATAAALAAAVALVRIEQRAAFCLAALLGFVTLWLAGTILPLITQSPILLSLHLLRAGVGIHLFGALAMAALTVRWAQSAALSDRRIRAPLLALAMATTRYALPLVVPIVLLAPRLRLPPRIARLRIDFAVAAILIAVVWPMQIVSQTRFNAMLARNIAAWRALGLWANAHSAPGALFLIPIGNIRLPPPYPAKDPQQIGLSTGSEVFETFAERRIWVDVRGGGAIMWAPSYHRVWRQRVLEVMALPDHAARMAYAQTHGIDFVIDGCGLGLPVVTVGKRCVYAVTRTSSARAPLLVNRAGS
jgi:hypothetical protein